MEQTGLERSHFNISLITIAIVITIEHELNKLNMHMLGSYCDRCKTTLLTTLGHNCGQAQCSSKQDVHLSFWLSEDNMGSLMSWLVPQYFGVYKNSVDDCWFSLRIDLSIGLGMD